MSLPSDLPLTSSFTQVACKWSMTSTEWSPSAGSSLEQKIAVAMRLEPAARLHATLMLLFAVLGPLVRKMEEAR